MSFENDLYIIKYVMIVIMVMNRIILRGSVGNNSSQPYLASGLAIVVPTFVLRSCYYSLVKLIQSFVPHYSTVYDYHEEHKDETMQAGMDQLNT